MDHIKIKLFGERNTATRAMTRVLRSDPRVRMGFGPRPQAQSNADYAALKSGIQAHYKTTWAKVYEAALKDNKHHEQYPLTQWKHAAPKWHRAYVDRDVRVLFTIRNPYSWALSMARRPYHMKGPRIADFGAFVARPWLTEHRDNCAIVHPNLIGLWNAKLQSYLDFSAIAAEFKLRVQFAGFEAFLNDPSAVAVGILSQFGLATPQVEPERQSTKKQGQDLDELQQNYRGEMWKKYLCAGDVAAMNQMLDHQLMEQFGYDLLDPAGFPEAIDPKDAAVLSAQMLNLAD